MSEILCSFCSQQGIGMFNFQECEMPYSVHPLALANTTTFHLLEKYCTPPWKTGLSNAARDVCAYARKSRLACVICYSLLFLGIMPIHACRWPSLSARKDNARSNLLGYRDCYQFSFKMIVVTTLMKTMPLLTTPVLLCHQDMKQGVHRPIVWSISMRRASHFRQT